MADRMEGGCACGRIRFAAEVDSDDAYLCHCRMCQRATGSVSIAFVGIRKDAVTWARAPDFYVSSPIARRPYCRECGCSLGFEFPDSETMDLTVAAFDDPTPFTPKHHFGAESLHRAWLNTEGLPEHKTSDYDVLVEKWVAATGKVPD